MTLAEEASRSLQGAWGLLRQDPAAPAAFNATHDGFWRSFVAAVILFPLALVDTGEASSALNADAVPPATRWAIFILVYVIDWTAWPLLAFYFTRSLGCGDRFIGYIVAYNWSQLLVAPVVLGAGLAGRALFGAEVAGVLTLAAIAAALVYRYLVARQMLGLPRGGAVLMVVAALALEFVLVQVTAAAFRLAASEPS
jgi:hypothetical protein